MSRRRATTATVFLIVLMTGLICACGLFEHEMSREEIDRVVEAVPEQARIRKAEPIIWRWDDSEVALTPVFDYHLVARVMSVEVAVSVTS